MDQESQPVEQPSLSLSDLVLLLNLIRAATERGAIKADELSSVGSVYDRLFKFLEASGAINKQAPAEQPADQPV
jgi:hypothetical protein